MQKKELRIKYKEKRSKLSNAEQDYISRLVAGHLCAYFDLTGKKISCFVPIIRFQEINTWLLLDTVKADFYLPVMCENENLKHVRYEGKDQLKKNSFGVLEPQSGAEINSDQLDIVLVPMLAINSKGYRVGYGKGYYDKFLANCKPDCIFIGMYQFDEFEEIDDVHGADIPLHYCIMPKGIFTFTRQ